MKNATFLDRVGFFFRKPEYVFHPVRTLTRRLASNEDSFRKVELPWGGTISVKKSDVIGNAIIRHGVYELSVTEVLWRLLGNGDMFIDVGANIGYMSHLMASRAKSGFGISFEPHPLVFSRLSENLRAFSNRVKVYQGAVGEEAGRLNLVEPESFDENEGTARLGSNSDKGIEVEVLKLDDILDVYDKI